MRATGQEGRRGRSNEAKKECMEETMKNGENQKWQTEGGNAIRETMRSTRGRSEVTSRSIWVYFGYMRLASCECWHARCRFGVTWESVRGRFAYTTVAPGTVQLLV